MRKYLIVSCCGYSLPIDNKENFVREIYGKDNDFNGVGKYPHGRCASIPPKCASQYR